MRIARRADDKPTWPGKWDQCVAGGLSAGEDIYECVLRECLEEASIPRELAVPARPASAISYAVDAPGQGIFIDYNVVYDLIVPPDFVPTSGDGEVAAFERVALRSGGEDSSASMAERLSQAPGFSPAAGLVVVDFLVRRGLCSPDPDGGDGSSRGSVGRAMHEYLEIANGLRLGTQFVHARR